MKSRLLIMLVMCLSLLALIPTADALREVLTVDEMSKRSDAIVIGTVQSTWIDIRLFEDYLVVDTAKIKVDDWLKNNKNSDMLEIRYYGYWAKTIDDLRGKHIFDNPQFIFESGQKVLVITTHEELDMVMGEGYYPFFEGSYVITGDNAVSQSGKTILLQDLKDTINSSIDFKPDSIQTEMKDNTASEVGEHFCAYIGFEKYPENLFAEFLQNPYNKDVTFLNFTDADLEQIPEFYEMILESNEMDYPLNDRVMFFVSPEEHGIIKNHLEQRDYLEFTRHEETILRQITDDDQNYRIPRILMDDKLYSINGLKEQVFSDRDVDMNIQFSGTTEEVKTRFVENTNPNKSNLIYFEINKEDKIPLAKILDAISQIQKSQDKIRMSEDVGGKIQGKVQDFFLEQNNVQFDNDKSKHTRYFILNGIMYETSFVIC
ncbi:hypothetical protein [Nitrosopumilus sp.]|uniref:hypothetical protein n=1 Tax=Nitrosopumilus sp. TaxID=2024843 RepID=UPI003D138E95